MLQYKIQGTEQMHHKDNTCIPPGCYISNREVSNTEIQIIMHREIGNLPIPTKVLGNMTQHIILTSKHATWEENSIHLNSCVCRECSMSLQGSCLTCCMLSAFVSCSPHAYSHKF